MSCTHVTIILLIIVLASCSNNGSNRTVEMDNTGTESDVEEMHGGPPYSAAQLEAFSRFRSKRGQLRLKEFSEIVTLLKPDVTHQQSYKMSGEELIALMGEPDKKIEGRKIAGSSGAGHYEWDLGSKERDIGFFAMIIDGQTGFSDASISGYLPASANFDQIKAFFADVNLIGVRTTDELMYQYVFLNDSEDALAGLEQTLEDKGYFSAGISKKGAEFEMPINEFPATHTPDSLKKCLEEFSKLAREANVSKFLGLKGSPFYFDPG